MEFKRVKSPGEGLTGFDSTFLEDGWTLHESKKPEKTYTALVPGNVRTTLLDAGLIPDPFIGKNNEKSKWVSDVSWVYETKVIVPSPNARMINQFPEGGLFHVVFDAIDYDASFFIDGENVCRQTGMFSSVDLATGIFPRGDNENECCNIKVLFHVQPWWRQHAVKSQMAFGWDFAPEMRTVGIWKAVRTCVTGPAFFSEVFVIAKPLEHKNPSLVNIRAKLAVAFLNPRTLIEIPDKQSLHYEITIDGTTKEIDVVVNPNQLFDLDLGEMEIPPWQPWSIGSQTRMQVLIRLYWKGTLSDEYRGIVVNRQVQWLKNPGTLPRNEKWTLMINNKKIFLRGINWVPPDALYGRIDMRRYQRLIDAAIDMNIDILRVWGGGIEEKSEFYEYCDEIGMMVWQEFPFACTNYPNAPGYLQIVRNEVEGIVKRTRRHPSVVVYCGGNEFNPFINAHIIAIVERMVNSHAPGIHCFKASPFSGDDHNWRMFGSWPLLQSFDINYRGPYKMLTEFGVQAAPDVETVRYCLDNETTATDIDSISDDLQYHKADIGNIKKFGRRFSQKVNDIQSMLRCSQSIQAYTLKYAIEACRAGWPNVSGVFPWQLSDPWPNVSWSIVDYHFRPKLAAKLVRIAYLPILPLIRSWRKGNPAKFSRNGDVIIHNATREYFQGKLLVKIVKKGKDGGETTEYFRDIHVNVSPDRPLKVTTVKVEKAQGIVIRLYLYDMNGTLVAQNFHFPAMEPDQSITKRIGDTLNARFDGWWRKYMIKLMELEKIREERASWQKLKDKHENRNCNS